MSGFKLLAIRPLVGCHEYFSKNLIKGQIYKFHEDYDFYNENEEKIDNKNFVFIDENGKSNDIEVVEIKNRSRVPKELYKIKTKSGKEMNMNISAIVGENGSGKSTILELLYALCYIIATRKGIISDHSDLSKYMNSKNIDINKLVSKINDIQDVYEKLKVEIFYQINDSFYSVKYYDYSIIIHREIKKGITTETSFFNDSYGVYRPDDKVERKLSYVFDELFFYTISINYSLYGLNTKNNSSWLFDLFHKNDGYQTPLVINPYRDKGNIDVNLELHLAQSRLLSNLVDETFENKKIVNNKTIDSILFTLDYNKFNTYGALELDGLVKKLKDKIGLSDSDFLTYVYNAIYIVSKKDRIEKINLKRVNNSDILTKYVYKKILKIYSNYEEYRSLINSDVYDDKLVPNFRQIFEKLIELKEDRSHVTLKLRQILNAIRFNTLAESDTHEWRKESDDHAQIKNKIKKHFYNIQLVDFIRKIKVIKDANPTIEIIELIPVACFIPTLFVKNDSEDSSISSFQSLSSGEQHFIHSLQSLLYHISNINSVFNSGNKKIKYQYLNLIFDEIELYFHPEYQRSFVTELINGIENMHIDNINGINVLFSTHSPFILSDIPSTNVLRLEDGKPSEKKFGKTFGANIHDLLANDFFLKDGFMGQFAKEYILNIIEKVNKIIPPLSKDEFDNIKCQIEIINEKFIKHKLIETLESKYEDRFNDFDYLISKKEDEIEKLKKRKNDQDRK